MKRNEPIPKRRARSRRAGNEGFDWIAVERSAPISMQAQIVRWLERLIDAGALKPGEQLPTEAAFVQNLGVSRVTIRLALDDLVARGLVTRSHGRGSFVARPMADYDLGSELGFLDSLLATAPEPEARLLCFGRAVPPQRVAASLGAAPGAPVVHMMRLYLSAAQPLGFSSGWLTADIADLARADVENRSSARIHAERLGRPVAFSTFSVGAEIAGAAAARLLGLRPRDAVLVLTRSRFDQQHRMLDHTRFVVASARYEITLSSAAGKPAAPKLRDLSPAAPA